MSHGAYRSPTGGLLMPAPAPCMVFSIDRPGIVTHGIGSGLAAGGLDLASIVGRSVEEVRAGWPEPIACVRRALVGEEVAAVVEWADRSWKAWYLPQRSPDGAVVGVNGFVVEVRDGERIMADRWPELYTLDPLVGAPLVRSGFAGRVTPEPARTVRPWI